ncbi:probable phosphoglycerate mutase [Caloramator quimbayensis]|uniref:Probable phosphoglycerate mutase n=1 Tax=Caloramator quimbayensis TaxID=1147123 RepID=A0A1T4X0N2_9CLOT|nr:histidine phosphatase family protein [Caloramator quimbayensis]SKA83162.1 probable phosphoglycerate mutase [Caloramator quimbayensis]
MSKIYLIRHGETLWNREQRSQGCSNDIPLSEEGLLQAKAIAKRLKKEKIDLVYSSDLIRAYKTASIISKEHNRNVNKCREFREINLGDWEGLRFDEIKEKYNDIYNVWRKTPHLAIIPNAERVSDIIIRAIGKLNKIIEENEDKNILIVSHGITIKVMIAHILGMELSNLHKIRQDNTALNIIEYNGDSYDILLMNDTCHLKEI